jgi:hypothetical protein
VIHEAQKDDRLLNYKFYDLDFVKTIHEFVYD